MTFDEVCGLGPKVASLEEEKKTEDDRVGPFLAYKDGYEWPNLYTELKEMMDSNIIIYPLAELRDKARKRDIQGENDEIPNNALSLPLAREAAIDMIIENKVETDSLVFYEDVFGAADDGQIKVKDGAKSESTSPATIVAFDDRFAKEELVYSIEVNQNRHRVTVCFRGSVTKTDWATDFEIYMKEVANPLKAHASQESVVRVHNGFYDYLFEPSFRGVKGPSGEELSEYQEILQEHLTPVLQSYPGYKLYVTGHSLGAALATLFAFEAAAEPDSRIPKPVSLFSIAGPYVGDESFRAAHLLLESLGKLRHLRVSNHKDLVPTVPKMSFRWNVLDRNAHVGYLFKHVGVNLRLYPGETPFELSFPAVRTGYFTATYDEFARGWGNTLFVNFSWNLMDYITWPWHSLKEYNKRTEAQKFSLATIQLNDLYSRAEIVGQLVPQF